MEAERREVSYLTRHLPMPLGTESMRIVSRHDYPAYLFLDGIRRTEQVLLALNYRKHLVEVTDDTTKVHGAYHLRMLRDSLSQFVIVHLYRVLL